MNLFYKKIDLDLNVIASILTEIEVVYREKRENINFTKDEKKNIIKEYFEDLKNLDYFIEGKKENGAITGELCIREEEKNLNYRVPFNEEQILLSLKEISFAYLK